MSKNLPQLPEERSRHTLPKVRGRIVRQWGITDREQCKKAGKIFRGHGEKMQRAPTDTQSLALAAVYWLRFPMLCCQVGYGWRESDSEAEERYQAFHAVKFTHEEAVKVLMRETERQQMDPSSFWEAGRICRELFSDPQPWRFAAAGAHQPWPHCLGDVRYQLPQSFQDAIQAAETLFVRLSIRLSDDKLDLPSRGIGCPGQLPSIIDMNTYCGRGRTELWADLFDAEGQETYRSPATIRNFWNKLPEEVRRQIDSIDYEPLPDNVGDKDSSNRAIKKAIVRARKKRNSG